MKILISDPFYPEFEDQLRKYGEVTTEKSIYTEADIILIRSATKADKSYLKNAKSLKLIIRGGVGIDNIDIETAKLIGIQVRNTPSSSSISVAEMAMTLMLSLTNKVVKADTSMQNNKWLKKQLKRSELFGKTLGIIGYGRIGSEVAKRGVAFGMTILGYHYREIKSNYGKISTNLEEVLQKSDYLSLHLPLKEDTRDFLNSEVISMCRPNTILINTGRGETVDETAIANALKTGKLGGYASDVWSQYPPTDSPLISAPNVLMTPHLGASTKECMLRIGAEIIQTIEEFISRKY
tara:strand:- start:10117 stop:10998 length:882 start_codon:yes stop_codon:yes gene_type:complete